MSARGGGGRGGRAGRPSGPGRTGASGRQIIGGGEVSWEHDKSYNVDRAPEALYPPMKVPRPRTASYLEHARVASFRSLRDRIRKGPFYTAVGYHTRASKDKGPGGRLADPFTKEPMYSQRYQRPVQTLPRFNTRIYHLKMFPQELYHILDPTRAPVKAKKVTRVEPVVETDEDTEPEDDAAAEARAERKAIRAAEKKAEDEARRDAEKEAADRSDNDEDERQKDDDLEGEPDPDDTFENEEQDDDYNAEGYFDNGENDGDSIGGDDDGGEMD